MSKLRIESLTKRFQNLIAVNGVSFEVEAGTILGLIGVNGAGKTTILNCINGMHRVQAGRILLNDQNIANRPVHDIARLGVGRTFQVPRVFRRMTLIENLLVPVLTSHERTAVLEARARELLESVRLDGLRHNYAEELSGGQQKLLELARTMMYDPDLVLLDEPFAGVHPTLRQLFISRIQALLEHGKTFVLVSHDLTSVYLLSSHIVALNNGQKIAEGTADEIRKNPQVVEAYLGA